MNFVASNNSFNSLKIIDVAITRRNYKIKVYCHFSSSHLITSRTGSFSSQLIFNVSTFGTFVLPESFRKATSKAVTSFWSMLLWRDLASCVIIVSRSQTSSLPLYLPFFEKLLRFNSFECKVFHSMHLEHKRRAYPAYPPTGLFSHQNNPRSTGFWQNNFQGFPQGIQSPICLKTIE